MKKLVDKFNERDQAYFKGLDCQFLKLSDESIGDKPNQGGSPIAQLVSSTESEASYLKIKADGENWLFPNILSTQVDRLINILKPSIFTIDANVKNRQLKKPAKLKEVSPELWEIAEIGEFIEQK